MPGSFWKPHPFILWITEKIQQKIGVEKFKICNNTSFFTRIYSNNKVAKSSWNLSNYSFKPFGRLFSKYAKGYERIIRRFQEDLATLNTFNLTFHKKFCLKEFLHFKFLSCCHSLPTLFTFFFAKNSTIHITF